MINSKFWQGFFALAPLISLFLILIGYFWFIVALTTETFDEPGGVIGPATIIALVALVFLLLFISFGSLVFYIVHAARNPSLQGNNMLLVWILLFVFANGIGQLVYWIVEILSKPEKDPVQP